MPSIAVPIVAGIAAVLAATGPSAACIPGARDCPIEVHMAQGTDTIALTGILVPNDDCCAYSLAVRAGQTLTWSVKGPAIRTTIAYPNGDADGPGLPASIPLPFAGVYVFSVRPNLMADGAFGPFTLTITIR